MAGAVCGGEELIRLLGDGDAEACWRLRLEALEREPLAFGSTVEWHQGVPVEAMAEWFGDGLNGDFALGCFAGEEMVGQVRFVRGRGAKEWHKGDVRSFYVRREMRGKGYGKALLKAMLERCREQGLEQVVLGVSDCQSAAIRLYREFGFVEFGREPRAIRVGEQYVDEVYLVLILRRDE